MLRRHRTSFLAVSSVLMGFVAWIVLFFGAYLAKSTCEMVYANIAPNTDFYQCQYFWKPVVGIYLSLLISSGSVLVSASVIMNRKYASKYPIILAFIGGIIALGVFVLLCLALAMSPSDVGRPGG